MNERVQSKKEIFLFLRNHLWWSLIGPLINAGNDPLYNLAIEQLLLISWDIQLCTKHLYVTIHFMALSVVLLRTIPFRRGHTAKDGIFPFFRVIDLTIV